MRTAPAVLGAALLMALPLSAQEHQGHDAHMDMDMPASGHRAELIADLEGAEEKYLGLAEAMRAHWDWRPGEGVRSAGEVFGHVAATNMMIPMLMGIAPPESFRGADQQETMGKLMALEQVSADEMIEQLRHSFMHARHALAQVPDARLDEAVTFFGQQGTVRSLMTMMATHMHEHLGQSIAYARTNGVVPPWSGGGE